MKTLTPHNESYSSMSEAGLLALLKADDKGAFTEIYHRFHDKIHRYALTLLITEEAAEDMTHEVFMKLWEFRHKLDIRSNFSAYLYRTTHNKAVNQAKKMAGDRALRAEILRSFLQAAGDVDGNTGSGWSPGEQRAHFEQLDRYDDLLQNAVNDLSPQRRRVYDLCKREGKTYEEAARELGISRATVKQHMAAALDSLRVNLRSKIGLPVLLLLLEKFF